MIALVCFALFLLTVIISQALYPHLHPARDFLSAYALSDDWFVMTAGFAAIGVGIILLSCGCDVNQSRSSG